MSAFTKPKKKNIRKRKQSSDSDIDSDDNDETRSKLDDIKELQKSRERQKGVDIVGLALGKKIPKTEDVDSGGGFHIAIMDELGASYLRQRSSNWSERDKLLAIQLVLEKEEELYGLCKGKYTNRMKQDSWLNVAEEFNLKADEIRTADQLKKCFENIRSSARKYVEDLKLAETTGGLGPREPKPSIKLIIDKIRSNPNNSRINTCLPPDTDDADFDSKWKIMKLSPDSLRNNIPESDESNGAHSKDNNEQSSHHTTGDQGSQNSTSHHHTIQTSKRKQTFQEILFQCELDKANLEKQKLSLKIEILEEKRLQDRSLFEAKMEILKLKKQCIRNDTTLPS